MQRKAHKPTLGIDIGRVIIGAVGDDGEADTTFLSGGEDDAMRTPATEGAFETIEALVEHFDGRVWLVSKCGSRVQARTRRWLAHHRFFERTGMAPAHLRFCLTRADKAPHCEKIGATHFIDDRLDVLRHLHGLVPHLYWFGKNVPDDAPAWVRRTRDWSAVSRELLS